MGAEGDRVEGGRRSGFGLRWDAVIALAIIAGLIGASRLPGRAQGLTDEGLIPITCADPDRFVLVSVGDVSLGQHAQRTLERRGGGHAFELLRPTLEGDALIGNLETPVALLPTSPPYFEGNKHRMKPRFVGALAGEGFCLLSLGNNHAMDQGPQGLAETRDRLRRAGIAVVGAGQDRDHAARPVILDAGHTRVAVIGAFPSIPAYEERRIYAGEAQAGVLDLDPAALAGDIAAARSRADVVLFSAHWGINYRDVTPEQERFAEQLVEAGVDVINGHGAHRSQRIELIDGVPVLYSLGNATFGSTGNYGLASPDNRCSLVARYTFEAGRLVQLEVLPILTDNALVHYQPRPAEPERARLEWEPYLERGGVRWSRGDDGWYEIALR